MEEIVWWFRELEVVDDYGDKGFSQQDSATAHTDSGHLWQCASDLGRIKIAKTYSGILFVF